MPILNFSDLFRRTSLEPLIAPSFVVIAALILGACSPWTAPTAVGARTTPTETAAACPNAQARYLSCGNGVKMVTYEAGFELVRYCEPLQQLEGKIRGFERNQPVYPLASGERAMLLGAAGWLLLPREPDVTDVPQSMAAWWNNRACTLPTALRSK